MSGTDDRSFNETEKPLEGAANEERERLEQGMPGTDEEGVGTGGPQPGDPA